MKKPLIKAIKKQMGCDSKSEFRETMRDVSEHGMTAGFGQFVYYTDTCKFFQANKSDIVTLAETMSDDMGEDVLSMIASFRALDNGYSQGEIAKVIYGNDENTQIENIMAWFAVETLAYEMDA